MAEGPSIELQRALVALLKADAGVASRVADRVYDEPPQPVGYPFVRIGNIDVRPLRTSGTPVASDILFSIEAHSRPDQGRVEATRIGEAVRTALDDAALAVAWHNARWVDFVAMTTVRAADGKSYQTNVAFQATLDV